MKWQVAFDPAAEKQFSKLGRPAQQDIAKYISKHLETTEDPRRFGKAYLSIKNAWRYRVGITGWFAPFRNSGLRY